MSEYRFDGVKHDGTVKFRRDTGETLIDVVDYLERRGISYEVLYIDSHMITIFNKSGKPFQYWATTGRWMVARMKNGQEAYRSNGIDDFVTRFLNKFVDDGGTNEEIYPPLSQSEIKQKIAESYHKHRVKLQEWEKWRKERIELYKSEQQTA